MRILYRQFEFQKSDIEILEEYREENLKSSTVAADEITVTVRCTDESINDFLEGAPLRRIEDDGRQTIYYVQSINRVDVDSYTLYGQSTVSKLIKLPHKGGIYTGQTAEQVIKEICVNVPVIVKTSIKDTKLYGWLPYVAPPSSSARDNLSQVLFAIGGSLSTDMDGNLRVEQLFDGTLVEIGASQIYEGARVQYGTKVSDVVVVEHQYTATGTERVELFSGTSSDGDLITFTEPYHSLQADGFTIKESGANYAVISAGSGTLTGIKYIHTKRRIERHVADVEKNVQTVENATLVSLTNSNGIADKLASYYKNTETIQGSILSGMEKPGSMVEIYHPYSRQIVKACVVSKNDKASGVDKATCEFLIGFTAEGLEQAIYDTRTIITQSGNWVVPDGVTQATVVCIGGGQGGWSGLKGEAPTREIAYTGSRQSPLGQFTTYEDGYISSVGGSGGAGGKAGAGGKIMIASVQLTPGQSVPVSIGRGGVGGTFSVSGSVAGAAGGNTIFGSISSASGAASAGGYQDPTTGDVYGKSGLSGIAGGNGSGGNTSADLSEGALQEGVFETLFIHGSTVYGRDGTPYNPILRFPGRPTESDDWTVDSYTTKYINAGVAFGLSGGAAVGGTPTLGVRGTADAGSDYSKVTCGAGGRGADAAPPSGATGYGTGGTGGNGGGGGGGCGMSVNEWRNDSGSVNSTKSGGLNSAGGGNGSDGGRGADGCVILFYAVSKKSTLRVLRDRNNKVILDKYGRVVVV